MLQNRFRITFGSTSIPFLSMVGTSSPFVARAGDSYRCTVGPGEASAPVLSPGRASPTTDVQGLRVALRLVLGEDYATGFVAVNFAGPELRITAGPRPIDRRRDEAGDENTSGSLSNLHLGLAHGMRPVRSGLRAGP